MPSTKANSGEIIPIGGRGAEASLRGFAAGCDIAAGSKPTPQPPALQKKASELKEIVELGIARLRDYRKRDRETSFVRRLINRFG